MATNERNRRILEHLQKTSNIKIKRPSPSLKSPEVKPLPAPPPPPPTPISVPTKPESRKNQVMQHLTRSGANFDLSSASLEKRKQKIKEHIEKSSS
ncbi:hypothetical protein [Calothrix rhizosoleniae]|uniref:hypothetical protein n=1 Tax=Calothrix rhizosoleniae TaxID=888997 RepID=UPI000B49D0B3|nr:hypothetical protein [Calothrix rhizosoleniae]